MSVVEHNVHQGKSITSWLKKIMLPPSRAHISRHIAAGAVIAAAISAFHFIPGSSEFEYFLKVGTVVIGAAAFVWLDVLTFFPIGEDE
jgi:hypothetical protein